MPTTTYGPHKLEKIERARCAKCDRPVEWSAIGVVPATRRTVARTDLFLNGAQVGVQRNSSTGCVQHSTDAS